MANAKKIAFNEYRYQLLPVSRQIQTQMGLAGEIRDLEDLKRKKNLFFKEIVLEIKIFSYRYGDLEHKKIVIGDNVFILKLGVERDLQRVTRDFKKESVENWPTVLVAFNNDPRVQKCLIEKSGGFQHTVTVVRILEDNFNRLLKRYQLSIVFEPIFDQHFFWDIVKRYEGKITNINFELISPNMSNISASLNIDLAELARTTNTQKTNLELNSDKDSSLTPSESDPAIKSLVEYSSQGGGDINIRARGIRKRIHTARGVSEVDIDQLTIENAPSERLSEIFKELMP